MTKLQDRLTDYLTTIVGERPWSEPLERNELSRLPIFLREKYQILRTDLFGRKLLLAMPKRPIDDDDLSLTKQLQETKMLRSLLRDEIVFVLDGVPAYFRNRLVHGGVSFIVPGTQMFLPTLMIDLTEHYSSRKTRREDRLSAVAQVVVLYHLAVAPLDQRPLSQIAAMLNYSAMSLSKAQIELQDANICEVKRVGKAAFLLFPNHRKDVWERAKPLLSTPVKRTQWVRWEGASPRAPRAGFTALSDYTMLSEESIPTFAMRDRHVAEALRLGELIGCPSHEEADARMELWTYDPTILSAGSPRVDSFSLYLSLGHNADDRVQKELDRMIEGVLHDPRT